ncbi:MAG: GNAT family N-acetyltransferase [Bacteroidales bacterium]|nr:GNAT family N-acetyltransferase [Bacteroidales bacterium]
MKGKEVFLRAMEPEDIDLLYKWENDSNLWYLSNIKAPFSRHVLEQYVMNSHEDIFTLKQLRLMIVKTNKPDFGAIGTIDLFDFDPGNKRAGIGILIDNEERGKGYASEAIELLLDYCFDTLHLHQVYCNITEDNQQSFMLFKKFGFIGTGRKKDWLFIKNEWKEVHFFQLINPKI